MTFRLATSLLTVLAALPLAAAGPAPTNPPIGGMSAPGGAGLAILRPCASAQLRAAVAENSGAMLHRELRITLTNASTRACAISGYPAVRLLDELKHARIVAETFSAERPQQFILSPGAAAAFRLRVATGDGTIGYMTVPILAIIPPGDVAPLYLAVTLPVAPTIDVTALRPASGSE